MALSEQAIQRIAGLHTHFKGGVRWSVTPAGVSIEGHPPVGTAGPPDTVKRVLGWFGDEINDAAEAYGVPPALLVAIICTESAGGVTNLDKVINARREEPGFVSDALTPSRVSTGCCQTLLSTAREALKQPKLTSADLAHPPISIRAAAAYIAYQAHLPNPAQATNFDPPLVAAAYNAGSLRPEPASMNRWCLACYPLGAGKYVEDFVRWYNDAVAVLGAGAK